MTGFYLLLCKGDPGDEASVSRPRTKARSEVTAKKNHSERSPVRTRARKVEKSAVEHGDRANRPGLYINIQVHISSDATPDQIDQIFASMAKHIYRAG